MNEKLTNLSIDCVIFGFEAGELKILLIKRDKEPELDKWSLPGGNIYIDEDINDAAKRLLKELAGIHNLFLCQIGLFGDTNRYPTRRVISVLYCALVKPEQYELLAGLHAKEVEWFNIEKIHRLPFDHNDMIEYSLRWLKKEIWRKPILANLLPEKFPLNQMQELFTAILKESIDNRNFRKKIINLGLVEKLDEKTAGGQQRPASLYQFKNKFKIKTNIL